VKSPPSDRNQMRKPILVLIICPTRELACQAAAEATKLLKYHPTIGAQVVIGGTNLSVEQKRIQKNPCQVSFFLCHINFILCRPKPCAFT
jgi:ATP-dependent RNA helicase MSS116